MKYIPTIVRVVLALILLQTLYFKFTAHPDSVYIFERVALGSQGRIGIGVLELIAAVLLLVPRYAWVGALLAMTLMSGAVIFHLTILGREVQGDGQRLFYMAVFCLAAAVFTLVAYRKDIPHQNG